MIAALLLATSIAAGTPVVAVIDEIQRNGIEEWTTSKETPVITFTLVKMSILRPEGYHKVFTASCQGPPFVEGDHAWVGQYVTFRMPSQEESSEPVWLNSLEDLRSYTQSISIPQAASNRLFEEARVASGDDDSKLWGRPLYGPTMFVDPKTRDFVRNDRYIGKLPPEIVIANTATIFHGQLTTMISWSSLQGLTAAQRRRLLMHESWHRIQKEIGFPDSSTNNAHLDSVDGRYWLQLELRALATALRASGEARTAAIRDAVSFRAARRAAFADAEKSERALENNEGLAEYTGWALRGTSAEESRLAFARQLEKIDRSTSFVRGFAYHTGPAYGLLLDTLAPGWTRKYKASDDLAAFTGIEPGQANPDAYGGAELRAAEEKRDREQRERVARFRAELVDGPVIELPMKDAQYGFDPNGVTSLGEAGNAYESLEITAPWGRATLDGGVRIASDFNTAYVPIVSRPRLQLKPGWNTVPAARPGDLRLAHE